MTRYACAISAIVAVAWLIGVACGRIDAARYASEAPHDTPQGTAAMPMFHIRIDPFVIKLDPALQKLGETLVANLSDFTSAFDGFDTKIDSLTAVVATIQQEIDTLKGQISDGGMSTADEQTALDRLAATQAKMDALVSAVNAAAGTTTPPGPVNPDVPPTP